MWYCNADIHILKHTFCVFSWFILRTYSYISMFYLFMENPPAGLSIEICFVSSADIINAVLNEH